jgi:HEAT repeat protein
MTARALVAGGACAMLVPVLSALPPSPPRASSTRALASIVEAQAAHADLPVRSTRVERRDAAAGLAQTVAAIQRADGGPLWLAWSVPAAAGREGRHPRWGDRDPGRCILDDDGEIRQSYGTDGNTERIALLVRSEGTRLTRVAFTDERCTVDAGSRTVYWLSSVAPAQSVGLIAGIIRDAQQTASDAGRKGDRRGQAIAAVALHGDPAADTALADFVGAGQPRPLRKDAAFWLGAARGPAGAAVVDRLARTDSDDDFRKHLAFVLTLNDGGIDTLLELARRDPSPQVRGQALFWLGQKAGQRAVAALEGAVTDDPDRDVRKKAVFALSQLPKDEGVPRLITVARTHRDPEVRKQAMFWLGQSGDERAVGFFEEILKK